jgi:tagaturonate reductase
MTQSAFEAAKTRFSKLNIALDKAMPAITPLGVAMGFVFAPYLKPFKPLVTYLFAYVTFIGSLGLTVSDFKKSLQKPLTLATIFLCAHVLSPAMTTLITRLCFPRNPDVVSGFVLLMSIPTAVSGYIWNSIYHGNEAMALTMILLDTILAPISTPLAVRLFSHSNVTIDTSGMIVSLIFMVVIPSIIGVGANQYSRNRMQANVVPFGKPFAKIMLLGVISINTAQVADKVIFSLTLLPIIATGTLLTFLGFFFGYGTARLLRVDRAAQVSMTFSVGMRNISAAMVLVISFFPPESAMPVIIGLVIQQTVAAFSGFLLFRKHTLD